MGRKSYDEKIIEEIGMAELPLIIHKLYKKHLGRYKLIDIGGDCMFRFGKTNVANVSYLATYIHFITIKENVLTIEGNVSWPADLAKHFHCLLYTSDAAAEEDSVALCGLRITQKKKKERQI